MSRSPLLDRREFLGAASAAAGLAAAAAIAPLSTPVIGSPTLDGAARGTRDASAAVIGPAPIGQAWDIDDMWGHAPRYAHPIPYSPPRSSPVAWDRVDPIDRMLVI